MRGRPLCFGRKELWGHAGELANGEIHSADLGSGIILIRLRYLSIERPGGGSAGGASAYAAEACLVQSNFSVRFLPIFYFQQHGQLGFRFVFLNKNSFFSPFGLPVI